MTQRFRVEFEVDVPDDMPLDAAEEWVAFEVGARCQMQPRHDQMNCDLEPVRDSFCMRPAFLRPTPPRPVA